MADPNATVVQPQPPAESAPAPASNPDRYELLDELARGGMGVVYRARDRVLNRVVGLKTLISPEAPESAVQRFRAEAHITGQLQHPNIPPVHDLGTLPDGRPFLAMKLIKGDTLDVLLKARPDPAHDRGRFVAVFEHIAQGVAYAHAHNVIHRDLKPLNVMVGAFGEVQVMDWGLAKVLGAPQPSERTDADAPAPTLVSAPTDDSDRTRAGSVMGTPAYMPREQAIGAIDQLDARSDVFSLGGILCTILTGKPPYVGDTAETTRQLAAVAKLDDAFARLNACGAEPELVALCKQCLSPEQADRPANAGAVARAVAEFRAEAERRARQTELDRVRFAEQRKRLRVQLALAGALVLLLAAGGAFAWWSGERKAAEAKLEGERDAEARNKADQANKGIDTNLKLSADLRKQYKFKQAEAALAQAAELAKSGAPDRAAEVQQWQRELAFVVKLDDIRYRKWRWISESGRKGDFNTKIASPEYRAAFADFGLDPATLEPVELAARVSGSGARAELVAALDDWALFEPDAALGARLLEACRGADPGPWLDRLRDPKVRSDKAAVAHLAADVDVSHVPPSALIVLSELMEGQGLDPAPLLGRARGAHPNEFELAFRLGQWHTAARNSGEQIGPYEAARALRPDNTAVLNNLGIALRDKGDLDGALTAYRKAIELDPKYAEAHSCLGNALRDKGDLDGAIAAHRKAIELNPKAAKAHYNLSVALYEKGDLDGTLTACRRAIEQEPKDAEAHSNLGSVLRDKGDLDGAIAAHRKAIELEPKLARAHSNLGSVLRALGDLDGAIAAHRKAIELEPKDAQAHYNLGVALSATGDRQGAIAAYRKAIELEPKLARAHSNLGNELSAAGDRQGAIAAYRKVIELEPKDAQAHYNLGNVLSATGDTAGAIAAYRKAIELEPKLAQAHTNLGAVFLQQQKYAECIECAKAAIKVDPKRANAHALLGFALQQTGDIAAARAALKEAARLDPKRWAKMLADFPPLPLAPPPRAK